MTEPHRPTAREADAAAPLLGLRVPLTPEQSAAKARRFGSLYFAEHWLRTMRGYGWTVVMTAVGTPLVYLFAMGVGLASLIDANTAASLGGDGGSPGSGSLPYLVFVAPALLATAGIMVAAEENTYSVMSGFKWRRTYYGPNASPLSSSQLVGGHTLGLLFRLLLTTGLYYLFLLLFGAVPEPAGWLMIFTAALGGMAFGLPLMAYASSIEEDKGQFAMVQRFVVMPLFLFSGTFFPLAAMPWAVQWIGWVSPLWHSTQLGRVLSYGHAEPAWLTVVHVLYLAVLAAAGWLLAKRSYTRRLGK
ncbi:ABC-2 type transporter [Arthrobacter crystallopoietes BAB-32]|uniref:Transport permease protein n=1 Tax=Arthrobacter crystallopoietes BAB-32 TaxID=1246476 RepID=N1UZ13_9MICC|nr:ABC transporter permease [Arthrobacter crystallopoietes]EMY33034.1 ABC-2 type transporter [Arthrobacter crystallopoietes BAB-32]